MEISFIGLGIMGSRMAANLLKAGHRLYVYNRTQEKAEPLLAQGALWADSPAAAGKQAEVIITMLATPEAVEVTALGENGFLQTLKPNSIWIDCSTISPAVSERMAIEAKNRDIRFLDAPVAGSKLPAEKGELAFFVGGEQADIEQVTPLLQQMGKSILHVGESGKGIAMKMVINLMLGASMAVFSEAVAVGESLGLSQEKLFQVLIGGSVTAPFLAAKKTKIESGDYEADFPLQWMQKDLQLATEAGYQTGVAMPIANVAKEIYGLAKRKGLGEQDFSAIFDYLNSTSES